MVNKIFNRNAKLYQKGYAKFIMEVKDKEFPLSEAIKIAVTKERRVAVALAP